jgi:hypothetical protein
MIGVLPSLAQGVTKRCRLPLLFNINFGDLTPYLTYVLLTPRVRSPIKNYMHSCMYTKLFWGDRCSENEQLDELDRTLIWTRSQGPSVSVKCSVMEAGKGMPYRLACQGTTVISSCANVAFVLKHTLLEKKFNLSKYLLRC